MDYEAHRQRMVEHFLWMQPLEPAYAKAALKQYVAMPGCPNPNMIELVQAEWWRRNCGPLQPKEARK